MGPFGVTAGALALVVGTFFLEDATTVGAGLVVASGMMSFASAYAALAVGIALGDAGLYVLGRHAGNSAWSRRLVPAERQSEARAWFKRHGPLAVVASRFVPGLRLPVYVAAGALRYPPLRFLAAVVGSGLVWTALLLFLAVEFGMMAVEHAGRAAFVVVGLLAAAVFVLPRLLRRPRPEGVAAPTGPDPRRSPFEFWSPWFFYLPVFAYGMFLALRFRSLTLPTAANPSIYSGGLLMESKSEILGLVPPEHASWVAAWTRYDFDPAQGAAPGPALAALRGAGLDLPVVVKPDVGQRGAGVRPVADADDLRAYLLAMRGPARLILQTLADEPHEAGLFYARRPGEQRGSILSLTDKEFPSVVGDGRRTLAELILSNPRLRRQKEVFFARHAGRLGLVPAAGEPLRLVFAGNHCQGAIFRNGAALITPALTARIDEIARAMPGFHVGRFDVKYRSREALTRGEGFRIVEINGAGGEMTHVWDPTTRLADAYRDLFGQWRLLYQIGAANRARGARPLGLLQLLRDLRRYRRAARGYPKAS